MKPRILGVDFGDARTGLAVSDTLGMLANGIGYVNSTYIVKTADLVAEKAKEYKVEKIIVGLPVNMNGTEGPRAEHAEGVRLPPFRAGRGDTDRDGRREVQHDGGSSDTRHDRHEREEEKGGG